MMNLARLLAIAALLLAPAAAAVAAEYHVDGSNGSDGNTGADWGQALATVGQALLRTDGTPEVDTVRVAEGTYNENLIIISEVVLEGGYPSGGGPRNPDLYVTTLDGQRRDSVILIGPGVDGATVDGFTITNGEGVLGGGGIWVEESRVDIRNNVITGNNVAINLGRGGGIAHVGPTPGTTGSIISDNVIEENTVEDGNGGGLAIMEFDVPGPGVTVTRNRIAGNSATGSDNLLGRGGGVYVLANLALLDDNEIVGNEAAAAGNAEQSGSGGGIVVIQADPVITGNLIRSNLAEGRRGRFNGSGAGVYAIEFSGDISDNEIIQNRAVGGSGDDSAFGGGVFVFMGDPTITSNVIQGNVLEPEGCAGGRGAGLYLGFAGAEVRDNEFVGNVNWQEGDPADGDCWDDPTPACRCFLGGGLWSYRIANGPDLEGNLFQGNLAAEGGGVLLAGTGAPTLTNNRIRSNRATTLAGAGALVLLGDPTLLNNEIVQNVGDGLSLIGSDTDSVSASVVNVTLATNGTTVPGPNPNMGVGLVTFHANGTSVRNTIVSGNGLADWNDLPESFGGPPSTPNITWDYCYMYDTDLDSQGWGAGNLSGLDGSPMFARGPNGRHYLGSVATGQASDSVCLDTGGDLAASLNLDALTTRTDEVPDSGTVDMGYHYPMLDPSGTGLLWDVRRGGDDLTLRFTRSGIADAHRVYRGELARLQQEFSHESPFSPTQEECDLADPTSFVTLLGEASGPGSFYYIVVPMTGGAEGSFGQTDLDADGVGDGERTRPEDSGTDDVRNGCP